MRPGQRFTFVVDSDTSERMERVILINDGRVVSRRSQGRDMIYTVEKT